MVFPFFSFSACYDFLCVLLMLISALEPLLFFLLFYSVTHRVPLHPRPGRPRAAAALSIYVRRLWNAAVFGYASTLQGVPRSGWLHWRCVCVVRCRTDMPRACFCGGCFTLAQHSRHYSFPCTHSYILSLTLSHTHARTHADFDLCRRCASNWGRSAAASRHLQHRHGHTLEPP